MVACMLLSCRAQTEGESAPLKFSQVFHLMPVGQSFVVTNGKQPYSLPVC